MFRLALPLIILASTALASERELAFTAQSDVLKTGGREISAFVTPRFGRYSPYVQFDNRAAVGFGLSQSLELQALLDVQTFSDGLEQRAISARIGALTRYRFFDARTATVGLAVLGSFTVGPQGLELEVRGVADKWFGHWLLALNAAVQRSQVWAGRPPSGDTRLELSFGTAYQLENGFSAGLEVLNRTSFLLGQFVGNATYVGPTVAYRRPSFWFAASLTPQVTAFKGPNRVGNGEPLELDDNERVNLRFTFGLAVP